MEASPDIAVELALRTLAVESQGLVALEEALRRNALGPEFARAVTAILEAPGRVIVTGMGKCGHVARKIAATLASTGPPAAFVHPAEASHGDLGMVQPATSVGAVLVGRDPGARRDRDLRQALRDSADRHDGRAGQRAGREADMSAWPARCAEACPNGLAPTTSTTMQLALGDALAVALMEAKGFSARDFGLFHPGGKLGAKLALVARRDARRRARAADRAGARMSDAIMEMSSKRFGCVGVVDASGGLAGIITDGDLRRHLKSDLLMDTPVEEVMTRSPRVIAPDALAAEALKMISRKIQTLLVVDDGKVVGIVNFHDLLRIGAA